MDKEYEKELEAFVDRIMEEATIEAPSKDFTKKLMSRIAVESSKIVSEPKPLISKSVLFFLFSVFSALLFYVLFLYGIDSGEGWFQNIQLAPHFDKVWSWFEMYTSSKIIRYAIVLFGFLFMVQIPLLKRYLDHHATLGQ